MRSVQPVDVRVAVRRVLCAALLCGGPPAAVADQAETTPFGEIVVTAQRREQNIQDVGIAVTPLSEETLQDLNITTATDIVRAVPSLKMNAYSSSQVVFNIRGVAQNTTATSRNRRSRSTRTTAIRARSTWRASRYSTSRESRCCGARKARCSAAMRPAARSSSSRAGRPRNSRVMRRRPSAVFNQLIVEGAVSGPVLRDRAGAHCLHQQPG